MTLKATFAWIAAATAFGVPPAALAAEKLVAECLDPGTQVGYRVYETKSEPREFRAEAMHAETRIDELKLHIDDAGTILWIAPIESEHQLTLVVNRQSLREAGYDSWLTDDDFHGHVFCQLH